MNFRRPVSRLLAAATMLAALLLAVPEAGAQQYLYQHYTERDGLANNAVNGMVQAPDGRLWFATRGGIVNFDGQDWESFGLERWVNEKEYSHISLGPEGSVWILSKRVPFRVQYLGTDTKWNLGLPPVPYLNTQASLFAVGELADGSPLVCLGTVSGHLCFWVAGKWHLMEDLSLIQGLRSYELSNGQLMISSVVGVLSIDPLTLKITHDPLPFLPEGEIFAMATDPATQDRWFVGEGWIGRKDQNGFSLLAEGLDFTQSQGWFQTKAFVDRYGGLYFGGTSRAYRFDPHYGLEELNRNTGRLTSGATGFLEDREGNTWITSLRGVSKLVSRRFAGLDRSQGLFNDEVSAVMEDSRGRIILGHEGGLTILDPDPEHLSFNLGPGELGRVMDLAEDSQGNIWAAIEGQGLARVGREKRTRWFGPDEGIDPRVFSVLIDKNDRVWVGGVQGFLLGEGDCFRPIPLPGQDQEIVPYIRRLYQASDGAIFLCTGIDGVIRYDQGEIRQWKGSGITTGNSSYAIHEVGDGRYFVGTGVGLFVLDGDNMVRTRFPDPVIRRPIYCIAPDEAGRVWFGTDAGVYFWDGEELQQYSVDDGLIGSEINRDGFEVDSRQQLWIGTDRGVSIYRPQLDLPRLGPPLLELHGFEVDGEWYLASSPLVLNTPPRTVLARFQGISFVDERHMGLRTWLENFEFDWRDLSRGPIKEVRYSNLPSGNYRFHVQVQNPDGSVSRIASSKEIKVKDAFLNRWWVSFLGLLLVTLVGYGLMSFWTQRRYSRLLEGEVKARTGELEASERAVRSESQRLVATLGSILDGVLALDADDQIVLCNPAAETILDLPREQLVGRVLTEILPPSGDREYFEHGEDWEWTCQHRLDCPRRGRLWLEISSSPIMDDDGIRTGSVVAFSDITQRLRMERELIRSQKLESLGLLAGGIAHDFNNLLTIMLGNIDLVECSPDLDDMSRVSLSLAKQASSRAKTLTEQLLTFARGGAPMRQLHSLKEIVDQSVALSFSGLNVRCEVKMPEDLWPVDVDTGQMNQVFNNLLINAAQAMPNGGTVQIVGTNLENAPHFLAEGHWIKVEVIDSGKGIFEPNLARIFDPYFTTKAQGSGLGLATSYSIITRHDGHLMVDSQEGQGSTFTIYLPRGKGEPPEESVTDSPTVQVGKKILVLEDELGIHRVLRGYLERLGLHSVFTTDGKTTVAMYEAALDAGDPFDLVLADLTIPGGMGGREAMTHLLEIDPKVKAVVISGYSNEKVLAEYAQHGFLGALGKPFHFDQLAQVVGQALGTGPGNTER